MYAFLADIMLVVHFAYVSYVVVGQLLIWLGLLCRWQWVRNAWFRGSHLMMIAIVAVESIAVVQCPLTGWETDLRARAGQAVDEQTFVGRMISDILFVDLPVGHWSLTASYLGVAVLIVATFVLAPPRIRSSWPWFLARFSLILTCIFWAFVPAKVIWGRLVNGTEVPAFEKIIAEPEWKIGLLFAAAAAGLWGLARYRQKDNPAAVDRVAENAS